MVEVCSRSCFADKSLICLLVAISRLRKEFDRDAPVEFCVLSEIDLTHTSTAELRENAVVSEITSRFGLAVHNEVRWMTADCFACMVVRMVWLIQSFVLQGLFPVQPDTNREGRLLCVSSYEARGSSMPRKN